MQKTRRIFLSDDQWLAVLDAAIEQHGNANIPRKFQIKLQLPGHDSETEWHIGYKVHRWRTGWDALETKFRGELIARGVKPRFWRRNPELSNMQWLTVLDAAIERLGTSRIPSRTRIKVPLPDFDSDIEWHIGQTVDHWCMDWDELDPDFRDELVARGMTASTRKNPELSGSQWLVLLDSTIAKYGTADVPKSMRVRAPLKGFNADFDWGIGQKVATWRNKWSSLDPTFRGELIARGVSRFSSRERGEPFDDSWDAYYGRAITIARAIHPNGVATKSRERRIAHGIEGGACFAARCFLVSWTSGQADRWRGLSLQRQLALEKLPGWADRYPNLRVSVSAAH